MGNVARKGARRKENRTQDTSSSAQVAGPPASGGTRVLQPRRLRTRQAQRSTSSWGTQAAVSVLGRNTSPSGSGCWEALPTMQVRGQEEAACSALRALPDLHSPTHPGHVPRVARPPGQGSVTWGLRHSPTADWDTVSSSQAGNRGGTKSVSSTQTRTQGTHGRVSEGEAECAHAFRKE